MVTMGSENTAHKIVSQMASHIIPKILHIGLSILNNFSISDHLFLTL